MSVRRLLTQLDNLISDALGSGFEFNVRGRTWNCIQGEIVQALTVEFGKVAKEREFSLSWGVAPLRWQEMVFGRPTPASWRHDDCALYGTVGSLVVPLTDPWWQVLPNGSAPEDALQELRGYLAAVNELMTQVRTPADLLDLLARDRRTRTWPCLPKPVGTARAALLALDGRRAEALEVLERLGYESTVPEGAGERIRRFVEKEPSSDGR